MNMKTLLHTSGMRALAAAGLLVAGLGFAATASATLVASVGGVPSAGVSYENFDNCALGGVTCNTTSGITVNFGLDAEVANGALSGRYAAPYLSNNNGMQFGDPNNGADATNYLTSGSSSSHPGAAVTLLFPGVQRYMGLLWGSVDGYNTLTFFNGAASVGTFVGGNISGVAGIGNCVGGNQGLGGTCYVNINLLGGFDRVVATSDTYAFEFDNVAFGVDAIGVPEPGVATMFLLGLLLLGSGYWLKRRENSVD
ncbi:MAG: hypothetical protein ABIU96_14240 [Rhodanobacter sp.]